MKANKFIIINNKFLSGVVELHKDLIPEGLKNWHIAGGGRCHVDRVNKKFYIYGTSHDFKSAKKEEIINALTRATLSRGLMGYSFYISTQEWTMDAVIECNKRTEPDWVYQPITITTPKPDLHLSIAKDYSATPGGRARKDGMYSAEQFYDEHLHAAMYKAIQDNVKLIIDLDGTAGLAGSFLDEAFGRLSVYFNDVAINRIVFVSNEEPHLIDDIKSYIKEWFEDGIHENSPLRKQSCNE
jgi:hypothetical protein